MPWFVKPHCIFDAFKKCSFILNASKMKEHVFWLVAGTLATRPKWHWIIVAYFHHVSKMYKTRHLYMLLYFNVILDASCKFSTRRNNIYDTSARIIKNPLNSTLFWTRHLKLGDASTQLRDASTQLGGASNFTLKYSSIFRRSVISTWRRVHSIWRRVHSTPRRVKNAIMTPMAYHLDSWIWHDGATLHQ